MKGILMEEQFMSWKELLSQPYDKMSVDPFTMEKIIMNGIENNGTMTKHELARSIADLDVGEAFCDGTTTPLEMNFLMGVNKAYNYFSCTQTETDLRITQIWELFLAEVIGHVQMAMDLLSGSRTRTRSRSSATTRTRGLSFFTPRWST